MAEGRANSFNIVSTVTTATNSKYGSSVASTSRNTRKTPSGQGQNVFFHQHNRRLRSSTVKELNMLDQQNAKEVEENSTAQLNNMVSQQNYQQAGCSSVQRQNRFFRRDYNQQRRSAMQKRNPFRRDPNHLKSLTVQSNNLYPQNDNMLQNSSVQSNNNFLEQDGNDDYSNNIVPVPKFLPEFVLSSENPCGMYIRKFKTGIRVPSGHDPNCEVCTPTPDQLKKRGKFPCYKCNKGFDTQEDLLKHGCLFKDWKFSTCFMCGKQCVTNSSLDAHFNMCHKNPPEIYHCIYCCEVFTDNISFHLHLQKILK